jgi:hypothetical protein
MHRKLRVLPWEISHAALERRVRGELAGGRAIDPDRMGEVSRGYNRYQWQAKLLRHSKPKGGATDRLSRNADTEGPNGMKGLLGR